MKLWERVVISCLCAASASGGIIAFGWAINTWLEMRGG